LSPTRSSRARIARVSWATASPNRRRRPSFQVAPRPTDCGKTVAGPHPGHTVQGLLPGAEGGETETVHRGGELVQECDAFVECEAGEEVVDALVQGGGVVAEEGRRAFGHVLRSLGDAKQEEDLEAELEVVRE
jgi:hypothetical protein